MIREKNNINIPSSDSTQKNEDQVDSHSKEWWVKQDSAVEAADNFYKLRSDEKLNNFWDEKYDKDAVSFFDDQNFEYLNSLEAGKRLNLLALSATSILVTPQMAEKYFKKFPDDLLAVDKIFSFVRFEGITKRNYHLFSICALQMDKKDLELVKRDDLYDVYDGELEQYYNIARRRKEAPKLLLSNFNDLNLRQDFAEFGLAASGLFQTMDWAQDENTRLDTSEMFSGEYQNLPEDKKSLFLRKCLAQFQYFLLFEETYNSCFTEESAEYFSKQIKGHHNVAHSMIFKTYQPGSVYKYNQNYFEQEMDWNVETGGAVEEYANHKMLLATLDELRGAKADKDENTKLVVEFWDKNRNPIFTEAVSKVLSEQNVNLAAAELLGILKSEKEKKGPINAMLYRLEFGKIGVSEEGVKYLEKVYDLGGYNNPDYHASRLTVNGEIGVFNEELELIKYFHLGKLDSEEKKMKAEVLDFTYETLFVGSQKESPVEREKREEYLAEFKKKYYQISEEEMFKSTDTRLNNLSFKEQGWFLIYFNQTTEEEKERLRNFVARYHENGIKTFLSLEVNQNLGDNIISLGNKLDKDTARIVFSKIADIVDLAEKENEEIEKLFLKDSQKIDFDWREVRLALLRKTQDIITNFSESTNNKEGGDKDQTSTRNLLRDLEKSKTEMLLLSRVLKTAKEQGGKVPLEMIKDLNLEKIVINNKEGVGLSQEEKEQMKNIAQENYQAIFLQKGDNYNPEAYQRIVASYEKSLEDLDGQAMYILKYKNEIICSNRFKKLSEYAVYGGSFNVSKEIQGLSLGGNFNNKVLEDVSERYDVHISTRKDNPANNSYERSGFVIVGEYKEKDGVEYYKMIKPAQVSVSLEKAA